MDQYVSKPCPSVLIFSRTSIPEQAGEELGKTDDPLLGARPVKFLGISDGVKDAPVIGSGGGPLMPGGSYEIWGEGGAVVRRRYCACS